MVKTFGSVAARLLGNPPTVVADVVEGLHYGRPIVVSFQEIDVETLRQSLRIHFLAAKFLDVQFCNALVQDANPLFRPPEGNDVSNVKMPADGGALELVDIAGRLEGGHDEVVPDVLDGDPDVQFRRKRYKLANLFLRARVGVVVGNFLVDDRRNKKYRRGPVRLGIVESLLHALDPFGTNGWIGVAEWFLPVGGATDTGRLEPGGLECGQHLLLVQVAQGLDSLKARGFHCLELLQDRAFDTHRLIHDGFMKDSLAGLGGTRQ